MVIQDPGQSLPHTHAPATPMAIPDPSASSGGSWRLPLGLQQAGPLAETLWTSKHITWPWPLTTAVVALVECDIGACKIVDELVLSNEESALSGDGIIDGGGEAGLGAVEGAYPATVNAQL